MLKEKIEIDLGMVGFWIALSCTIGMISTPLATHFYEKNFVEWVLSCTIGILVGLVLIKLFDKK